MTQAVPTHCTQRDQNNSWYLLQYYGHMLKIHKFIFCMQVKMKFFFYNFLISMFPGYFMLGSWTNKPINIFNLTNKDSFWKKHPAGSWFKKLILFFIWHKIYTYFHKPYQGMSIAFFFFFFVMETVGSDPSSKNNH